MTTQSTYIIRSFISASTDANHPYTWEISCQLLLTSNDSVLTIEQIEKLISDVLTPLTIQPLNEVPYFSDKLTTVENVTKYFALLITSKMDNYPLKLTSIEVGNNPLRHYRLTFNEQSGD